MRHGMTVVISQFMNHPSTQSLCHGWNLLCLFVRRCECDGYGDNNAWLNEWGKCQKPNTNTTQQKDTHTRKKNEEKTPEKNKQFLWYYICDCMVWNTITIDCHHCTTHSLFLLLAIFAAHIIKLTHKQAQHSLPFHHSTIGVFYAIPNGYAERIKKNNNQIFEHKYRRNLSFALTKCAMCWWCSRRNWMKIQSCQGNSKQSNRMQCHNFNANKM